MPTTQDPAERLRELGEILALALARLDAKNKRDFSGIASEISLDFLPGQSSHASENGEPA